MQQFQIGDSSAVASARRGVNTLAAELGFDAEDAGRAALVATEIGTNLVKHGNGGELIAQKISRDNRVGVELLGLDKGPGMDDVARCLRDGYSTGSSPGTGLGAMERLSQRFEIYSRPGWGTAVLAQLWPDSREPSPGRTELGALVVPKPGEVVCGDRWCYHERVEGLLVAGVDGLGHGLGAEHAATEACRTFDAEKHRPALRLLQMMHEALRPTRGAAVTLLEVDWDAGRVTSVGVGNVAAALINGAETKRIATDNGIVGHVMSRPRELTHSCQADTVLVLHSDGLTASWQADRYPGLMQHHPALIAGVLYRDCRRGRDDSLIVVIRRTRP
ncbi:ATP-binding SpoIIE family protein phosphatase [Peristeroidobacter agariperforans]|uniref:ATP-binding SpoIIE family protein phosphatase n=1 Tax=Peristeroidobacter agariperforans TaxID=268404 RepID=UPI00101DB512|nr:ATP-binding SpoIIE family protein phosphatase [Peristeroidobacter agariperforans]